MSIRTHSYSEGPRFSTPVVSFALFALSGAGFGLLFDRTSLFVPDFWIIFPLLLPFFLLRPSSRSRAFAEGMVFGLVANLIGIRWLLVTMQDYGHLPLFTALGGLFLFSLYLSLFPAFFRWGTLAMGLWREDRKGLALRAILLAPALWILSEAARTEILTGFPWNPLGSLLFGHRDFELPARFVGTTGLSFLIVTGSLLLALIVEEIPGIRKARSGIGILAGRVALFSVFLLIVKFNCFQSHLFQDPTQVDPGGPGGNDSRTPSCFVTRQALPMDRSIPGLSSTGKRTPFANAIPSTFLKERNREKAGIGEGEPEEKIGSYPMLASLRNPVAGPES